MYPNLAFWIIIVILIIFVIVWIVSRALRNPKVDKQLAVPSHNPSTVTFSSLGYRGDMGNQMYQIACLMAAGQRSNCQVYLPPTFKDLPIYQLFDLSGISIQPLKDKPVNYREMDNYELINIPADGRNYDIRGYRQSRKYFKDLDVRSLFKINPEYLTKTKRALQKMLSLQQDLNYLQVQYNLSVPLNDDSSTCSDSNDWSISPLKRFNKITPDTIPVEIVDNYIAIHIRRGDYIKTTDQFHLLRTLNVCSLDYYRQAVIKMRQLTGLSKVVVCTDSPDYAKANVNYIFDNCLDDVYLAPIVSNISPKFTDFITLYCAKGIITSNSTYSGWASYLQEPGTTTIISCAPWWNENGFIPNAFRLNGPHIHRSDFVLLHYETGLPVTLQKDTSAETLNLYRIFRSWVV